jgi:hypothetical protein
LGFLNLIDCGNALSDDSPFKSLDLELVFLVNSGGIPLLLPPPSIAAWKFFAYYSIFSSLLEFPFSDTQIVLKPHQTKWLFL